MRSRKITNPYTMQIKNLEIHISRRKIRNVNLYIRPPHGEILVTAPYRVEDEYIRAFILRKYDWIRLHQERLLARQQMKQQYSNNNGKRTFTTEEVELLYQKILFYASKWEPVMGVHCTHWTIRDMKTRWGSCSVGKATIRINLQLAGKPDECLEYIIVHELTHLLEPSHNRVFHAYMTRFLPDWKQRDQILKMSEYSVIY